MRDSRFSAMVRAVRENHHKQTEVLRISINMAKSGNNINRSEEEGRGETLTKKLLGKTNHTSLATGCTLSCIPKYLT